MDDEPGFFLENAHVTIMGLGLMGGSLALALKGKCARLTGIESDPRILQEAQERGIIDDGYSTPAGLPSSIDARIVDALILATPIHTILDTLRSLDENLTGQAIVLDLGSTKQQILAAMEDLPERFDPVGGHPMCGKENSGFALADTNLYHGATFAFCALERTSDQARQFAGEIAAAAGSIPFWCDAAAHDRWVATTSHLPYLLANTLAAMTPLEAAPLAGPGYRSASRLAPTPIHIMQDILATNRDNVLAAVQEFQDLLAQAAALLADEDAVHLTQMLKMGQEQHAALAYTSPRGQNV